MIDVEVIETSSLGDRSYLAHDGEVAVVVDPQRDVDRVLALAGRLGVRISHVLETHVHNDYVSGGLELARLTGAAYVMSAPGRRVPSTARVCATGTCWRCRRCMSLRVLATPGHTFHHLSYVLEGAEGPLGVFTGGSLLFGTTGRTDLLGDAHAETLARAQHASARTMADSLPDGAQIWPTHGFGSFCTASPGSRGCLHSRAREGGEPGAAPGPRGVRPADVVRVGCLPRLLRPHGRAEHHRGAARGPARPDRRPTPSEVARRLQAGEWVVDLRSRKAYLDSHLAGTISLGLDGPMATWLGWMAPHGAPITLLGEDATQVAQAQRELVRIGIDRIAATATGTPAEVAAGPGMLTGLPSASFADLAASLAGRLAPDLPPAEVVLDVRLGNEWDTCHIDGAVHVPLPDLADRVGDVPPGSVWVHCGSGYRATAAASLLTRAGRTAVVVDDDFDAADAAGVPLITST